MWIYAAKMKLAVAQIYFNSILKMLHNIRRELVQRLSHLTFLDINFNSEYLVCYVFWYKKTAKGN